MTTTTKKKRNKTMKTADKNMTIAEATKLYKAKSGMVFPDTKHNRSVMKQVIDNHLNELRKEKKKDERTEATHNIKQVIWHWNEGHKHWEEDQIVDLEEADRRLHQLAVERGNYGGYTKVKISVVFNDGSIYEQARIDVHDIRAPQETIDGELGVLKHLQTTISFYAGLRKPGQYTQNEYEQYLRMIKPFKDEKDRKEWLERVGL